MAIFVENAKAMVRVALEIALDGTYKKVLWWPDFWSDPWCWSWWSLVILAGPAWHFQVDGVFQRHVIVLRQAVFVGDPWRQLASVVEMDRSPPLSTGQVGEVGQEVLHCHSDKAQLHQKKDGKVSLFWMSSRNARLKKNRALSPEMKPWPRALVGDYFSVYIYTC